MANPRIEKRRWKWSFTPRWAFERDGITCFVYSRKKPDIEGVRSSGYWDESRCEVVCNDLVDYNNPDQYQDWNRNHG